MNLVSRWSKFSRVSPDGDPFRFSDPNVTNANSEVLSYSTKKSTANQKLVTQNIPRG